MYRPLQHRGLAALCIFLLVSVGVVEWPLAEGATAVRGVVVLSVVSSSSHLGEFMELCGRWFVGHSLAAPTCYHFSDGTSWVLAVCCISLQSSTIKDPLVWCLANLLSGRGDVRLTSQTFGWLQLCGC